MIGPRPTRGGIPVARGSGALGSSLRATGGGSLGSSPPAGRNRSRSRNGASGRDTKRKKEEKKEKKDKEFAWMDSSDESEKAPASPASSHGSEGSASAGQPVPIEKVETLGQMARLAPDLEKRLKQGEVKPRELIEVVSALKRSKFFDGNLFQRLAKELRLALDKRRLGSSETLEAVCSLAELNAYDAGMFEAACDVLRPEVARLPEASRQRLDAALKQVNHRPGDSFLEALRVKSEKLDKREPCPLFFRGQCKWGPKCKLSHDDRSFEKAVQDGTWRPPSQSGGKSVGFKQSNDMFKADRCGALW